MMMMLLLIGGVFDLFKKTVGLHKKTVDNREQLIIIITQWVLRGVPGKNTIPHFIDKSQSINSFSAKA